MNPPEVRLFVIFPVALALSTVLTVGCAGSGGASYQPPTVLPPYAFGLDPDSAIAKSLTTKVPQNRGARSLKLPRQARDCYDRLWHAGVTFELVKSGARGVAMPVRVTSPVGGVRIHPMGKSRTHAVLDCRLALRLLAWAPALRSMGVSGIEHYSVYRPGARIAKSGKRSAHASALAIDLAKLHLDGGQVYSVLTDWEDRDRGESPCPKRSGESRASQTLRASVCDAVDRGLFQVVLTPHHDKAHQNHVHLELRPNSTWTYVR